jgi:hypothetical protein
MTGVYAAYKNALNGSGPRGRISKRDSSHRGDSYACSQTIYASRIPSNRELILRH